MGAFQGYNLPRDIVMVSTADWDEGIWTNKQQIASRLVGDFRVLYIEPLASMAEGKRGYVHRYWRDTTGVHILRPPGAIPFGQKLHSVNDINHKLVAPIVRDRLAQLGFKDYLLWIYPPSGAPFVAHLDSALSCYDCVDEYSAMPGAWMQATRQMERRLINSVDAVFTTARSLYEDKVKYNPNTHFIPNVADFDLFRKAVTAPPASELAGIRKPIIGFVGSLNYKLDDALLERLFTMRPSWNFVFVGPDRGFGIERFLNLSNVHFLGKRSREDLPSLMAAMDVCIIPYKVDRYTRGVLPMKFFEYLASGRPIVATRLSELEGHDDIVDLTDNATDFARAIEKRLAKDSRKDQEKRVALAAGSSWEKRISGILDTLEKTWSAKNGKTGIVS